MCSEYQAPSHPRGPGSQSPRLLAQPLHMHTRPRGSPSPCPAAVGEPTLPLLLVVSKHLKGWCPWSLFLGLPLPLYVHSSPWQSDRTSRPSPTVESRSCPDSPVMASPCPPYLRHLREGWACSLAPGPGPAPPGSCLTAPWGASWPSSLGHAARRK